MVDIQPREVALGMIFKYPNPIERSRLLSKLEDHEYTKLNQGETRGVFLGEGGPQIGEAEKSDARIAKKEGLQILYNPNATIDNIGDCAFITVRSEEGSFDVVFDEISTIKNIVSEENLDSQILLYELTLEASIRVSTSHTLDQFYSSNALENISEISGIEPSADIAMFTSESDGKEDGWYRLILDSISSKNPILWRLKHNRRHSDYEELDEGSTRDLITRIVDITKEGSE